MKCSILLLLAFSAVSLGFPTSQKDVYSDRNCGRDLSKLWLDIVIVVDNSIGMTADGLSSIAADAASLFDDNLIIGVSPAENRTTRIGLITYNSAASVVADLNTYTSLDAFQNGIFDALSDVSDTEDSFLQTGLAAAEELLQDQSTGQRHHYKKLVLVYASAYKGVGSRDPVPAAQRLIADGVYLATVAYAQDNSDEFLKELAAIASPGFHFTNKDDQLINEIQDAMVQVNCFCPDLWKQVVTNPGDEHSYKYGVCLLPVTIQAAYTAAKMSCRTRYSALNSALVTEMTQLKHDNVAQAMFSATRDNPAPYSYFMALEFANGGWNWSENGSTVPVPPYTNWATNYPKSDSTLTRATSTQFNLSGPGSKWINVNSNTKANYVCEMESCDSTHYCESKKV